MCIAVNNQTSHDLYILGCGVCFVFPNDLLVTVVLTAAVVLLCTMYSSSLEDAAAQISQVADFIGDEHAKKRRWDTVAVRSAFDILVKVCLRRT